MNTHRYQRISISAVPVQKLFVLAMLVLLPACRSATPALSSSAGAFRSAAVATDHLIASEAGVEMLRRGGNAVDAAVAASFALSVVRPYSCGIGGGGFMVIHLPHHPEHGFVQTAINYRETAPGAITPDHYQRLDDPKASTRGGHAVAVPGTVAGLLYALDKYGMLDRATVLGPAIRAAEEGFAVDRHYAGAARTVIRQFQENPQWQQRFAFTWERYLNSGDVRAGQVIRLPEKAAALRLIAQHGAEAFYTGPIAEAIAAAVARDGGVLRMPDLAGYRAAEVQPLRTQALGHTFLLMPPPSSGGVAMAQALGIVQLHRSAILASGQGHGGGRWNPVAIHIVTEAMKHAFADRAYFLADPDFAEVPVQRLISPDVIAELAGRIDPQRTRPPETYGMQGSIARLAPEVPDDAGTSHLCVVDSRGGAVACTETINLTFGSLLPVPEFGFVLNNEMDDFTTRRGAGNAFGLTQSELNHPEPGKRPLSSMTPTIALDGAGRVAIVAGGAGGPRIISGTLLAVLNVVLHDAEAHSAVAWPRFHHQWSPDRLNMEPDYFTVPDPPTGPSTAQALLSRGHQIQQSTDMGVIQLIRRTRDQLRWDAASDPRKGGRPAGL